MFELVSARMHFFDLNLSYSVFCRTSAIYKDKGTFLRNYVLNSGLRPKYISPRHVDRRNLFLVQLDNGGRSERDKLDRRRSTALTIPPPIDR